MGVGGCVCVWWCNLGQVEICCDLHHPNLVQLLGYATKPRLLIVQELLLGNALDKQLYVEKWLPDAVQQLKVPQIHGARNNAIIS